MLAEITAPAAACMAATSPGISASSTSWPSSAQSRAVSRTAASHSGSRRGACMAPAKKAICSRPGSRADLLGEGPRRRGQEIGIARLRAAGDVEQDRASRAPSG